MLAPSALTFSITSVAVASALLAASLALASLAALATASVALAAASLVLAAPTPAAASSVLNPRRAGAILSPAEETIHAQATARDDGLLCRAARVPGDRV